MKRVSNFSAARQQEAERRYYGNMKPAAGGAKTPGQQGAHPQDCLLDTSPARRDGGIRLLLAPCAGDARPRRRKDEGIRLSDRDEILGVAAGAETQGGIDHLRRTPRGHLQDERRHLPRSVLRRAGTPAAQNQGREKSIEYEK